MKAFLQADPSGRVPAPPENRFLISHGAGFAYSFMKYFIDRITHGPVTPMVPGSIYQMLPCTIFIDPNIPKPIECLEQTGY